MAHLEKKKKSPKSRKEGGGVWKRMFEVTKN